MKTSQRDGNRERSGTPDREKKYAKDMPRNTEKKWRYNEPNRHVIMNSLPADMTEAQICHYLDYYQAGYENIKLVYDKMGYPKGFGFIDFISVEHAKQFVEQYGPFIQLGPHEIRIDYSKASYSEGDQDWKCLDCGMINFKYRERCYKCGRARNEHQNSVNDGSRDVSDIPHHILLVRNIDPTITEQSMYDVFTALYPHIVKAFLIKDRSSKMSWEYGMLVYHDIATAAHVLRLVQDPTVYSCGFYLGSKPISIGYCHSQSFIQAYAPSEWNVLIGSDAWLYWDENAYASEYPKAQVQAKLDHELVSFYNYVSTISAEPQPAIIPPPPPPTKPPMPKPKTIPTPIHKLDKDTIALLVGNSPKYTNFRINGCLLCQRKFKSTDDLRKHQRLSKLHKDNLNQLSKDQIKELKRELEKQKREQLQAIPQAIPAEKPANVGAKLLKSMGWKEGKGLGANETGIIEPINPIVSTQGAGIGSMNYTANDLGGGSYQEKTKRIASFRFRNLE